MRRIDRNRLTHDDAAADATYFAAPVTQEPSMKSAFSLRAGSVLASLVLVASAAASTAPDLAAQDSAVRPLSLEQYLDMESVSNPQISPDGERVVYTRGWVDKTQDRRMSSLWIMNADGTRNRELLEGGGARWSPDGSRILFTASGEPSGSQLFVRWMDAEGAVSQVTRLENGPSNARWSPDGEWIAFTARVDDKADFEGVQLPGRPSGARWTEGPKIVERAGYKRDRAGYVDTGWTHVFVVPADGGTPRQLTDGEWNHGSIAWTPDGSEILFSSHRADDWDRPDNWMESEIYAVRVEDGTIRQLTDRRGPDGNPVPSPDGRLIAYIAGDEHDDTYRNQRIYVMNRDGSNSRLISGDYDRQSGESAVGSGRKRALLQRVARRVPIAPPGRRRRWCDAADRRKADAHVVVVLGGRDGGCDHRRCPRAGRPVQVRLGQPSEYHATDTGERRHPHRRHAG